MNEEYVTADVIQLHDRQAERKLKACLFRKLQKARLSFKDKHITARGRNNFNNFDYITLEDIVKEAIPLLLEHDLSIHQKFYQYPPVVDVVDLETGYTEAFGSNIELEVDGKNHNQKLQALGSNETYLRRYIYMQILDIVAVDPDNEFGKPDKMSKQVEKSQKTPIDTHALIKQIFKMELERDGILTPETIQKYAGEKFQKGEITRDQFRQIKAHLKQER